MALPGLRASIWVGWLSGIIFTTNPRTFPTFKSWRSPYTVYVVSLYVMALVLAADLLVNVLPNATAQFSRHNFVSQTVLQGFIATMSIFLTSKRIYLTWQAKSISLFISTLKRCVLPNTSEEVKRARGRNGRISLICFGLCVAEAVLGSLTTLLVDRTNSWFYDVNEIIVTLLCFVFLILPNALIVFVVFTLINSTVYILVDLFVEFCGQVEHCIKSQRELMVLKNLDYAYIHRFRTPGGNKVETMGSLWSKGKQLQQAFRDIQGLFSKYDKIFGPLILLLVVSCTMGAIQSLNGILNSGDEVRRKIYRAHPWANLIRNILFLTILDVGYKARELVSIATGRRFILLSDNLQ